MGALRIAVMLRTGVGGQFMLPQIDEFRRRGHEVVAILPPGRGKLRDAFTSRGVEVHDSPFDFRFRPTLSTLRGLWALRRLIRSLRPDVLNYHLYATALAARLAAARLPVRRVHMVAGPLYLESPVIRSVERLLWRLDHVTICCTRHISELYRALGCPAQRRPVAQYGVDLSYFDPLIGQGGGRGATSREDSRAKARAEIGVDDDTFVVIMVAATYSPKRLVFPGQNFKGHDLLLAAWESFHAAHPRSRLLMIGEGFTEAGAAHRAELMRRYDHPSISWLGWVPDLRPYFLAADVNVTPSLSEGSNGVVREASAMGVPSIVSDAGGLPEAVNETFGWIVPRGEVAPLRSALHKAHGEFEDGSLAIRAERARQHAVAAFDRLPAAATVADIVTGVH